MSSARPSREATTSSMDLVYFEWVEESTVMPRLAEQIRHNEAYTDNGAIIASVIDETEGSAIVAYDKETPGKPIVGHIFFSQPDENGEMTVHNLVGDNYHCRGVGSRLLDTAIELCPTAKKVSL